MTESSNNFIQLPIQEAPAGLCERIKMRIEKEKLLHAARHAAAFTVAALVSAILFVQAAYYMAQELYISGFLEYVRLFFTDTDVATESWHAVTLSILETFPALPVALVSASLILIVWSLTRVTPDISVLAHAQRGKVAA